MANISGIIKSIRNFMRQDRGINGDAQRLEQLGWMLFLKIFDDKDKEQELEDNYRSPIPEKFKWRNWAQDDEGITGDSLLTFVNDELFVELRELPVSDIDKRRYFIREIFRDNNNYMKSGTVLRQVLNKINEINFNSSKDKQVFGRIYEDLLKELQSAGKSGEFYTPRGVTQFMVDIINPQLGEKILDPACGTGGFLTAAIENMRKETGSITDRTLLQNSVRGIEVKPLPHLLAITNLILHDVEVPEITYDDTLAREITSIKKKEQVDIVLANPPFGGVVSEGMEKNVQTKFQTKESADLFLLYIIRFLKPGGRAAIVLPDGSLTGDGVKARIREKWLQDCNLHTIVRLPNSVFKPYATVATNLLFFTKGEPTKEIWYYEHQIPEGQKSYSKTRPIEVAHFADAKQWWEKREESEVSWKYNMAEVIKKAKKDAQPHRDKATAALEKSDSLKIKIKVLKAESEEIKEEDPKRYKNIREKMKVLSAERVSADSEAAQEEKRADDIYYSAFNLDVKNPEAEKEQEIEDLSVVFSRIMKRQNKIGEQLNTIKETLNL